MLSVRRLVVRSVVRVITEGQTKDVVCMAVWVIVVVVVVMCLIVGRLCRYWLLLLLLLQACWKAWLCLDGRLVLKVVVVAGVCVGKRDCGGSCCYLR